MGVFCRLRIQGEGVEEMLKQLYWVPLDLNNPWKNEGFYTPNTWVLLPRKMNEGCGFPWYRLVYRLIYTYTWYIWVNQKPTVPKISTTCMKLILQLPFRWGDVTMIQPKTSAAFSLTWAMFQALTPTITRTDPWNCLLQTVYIAVWCCVGSLEIYLFSPRSPDEWMFVQTSSNIRWL